jgi:hypothetical protein
VEQEKATDDVGHELSGVDNGLCGDSGVISTAKGLFKIFNLAGHELAAAILVIIWLSL